MLFVPLAKKVFLKSYFTSFLQKKVRLLVVQIFVLVELFPPLRNKVSQNASACFLFNIISWLSFFEEYFCRGEENASCRGRRDSLSFVS